MTSPETPSLLEFPCEFPIKAMGPSSETLEVEILAIVNRHAPGQLTEGGISIRQSKGGKYTAVTITLKARSQAQLDAIYHDLSRSPAIIMVF